MVCVCVCSQQVPQLSSSCVMTAVEFKIDNMCGERSRVKELKQVEFRLKVYKWHSKS